MPFNGEQRVRSLDSPMLARIAGQNDPRIPFDGETKKLSHLATSDLTSLVHDDHRIVIQPIRDLANLNRVEVIFPSRTNSP